VVDVAGAESLTSGAVPVVTAAEMAGITFTELANGSAACDDPAALQTICDSFTAGTVQVWFARWMARLPLPLTPADHDAGFWWDLSMRQIDVSRTLVFDHDCHARTFFEALLADNMDRQRRAHTHPVDQQRNPPPIRQTRPVWTDHRRTCAALVALAPPPPSTGESRPLPQTTRTVSYVTKRRCSTKKS
jgi:hypothetical protein